MIIIKAIDKGSNYEYLNKRLKNAIWCFDEKKDAMDTFLRSLELAGDNPCLHLEDDIILTKDFENKYKKIVKERENDVIQFFSMRQADITIGSRYDNNFMMTQCFYLPRYYSKLIRDYYEIWGKKETEPNGYDICIGDFIRKYIRKYYIHCPSLVQHRQDKSRIDLRRSTKRQSKTFIDPDYD